MGKNRVLNVPVDRLSGDFVKGGSRGYIVARAFRWSIDKADSGWVFTIPEGKEFEISVPWFARWYISPDDPAFLKDAAVHDTLLDNGYSAAFSDSQWFEVAMSEHAPGLKTWVSYRGIRLRRFVKWIFKGGKK